jgi:hypothetical protein
MPGPLDENVLGERVALDQAAREKSVGHVGDLIGEKPVERQSSATVTPRLEMMIWETMRS